MKHSEGESERQINGLRRRDVDSDEDDEEEDDEDDEDISKSGSSDYESEDEEIDNSKPYARIVQRLDLPLGTVVNHLAFPTLPQLTRARIHLLAPALLRRKLVVALACADNSIRLLTLPLKPPSSSLLTGEHLQYNPSLWTPGHGTWGEELVTIPGAHQSLPKGVTITLAPQILTRSKEHEDVDDDSMSETDAETGYDVLLASHSADLSGIFLIHRIPVSVDGATIETSPGNVTHWRRRPLASPATKIDFSVPESSSSSTPRVLVAESKGQVRIFDCCSPQASGQGSWVVTLHSPVTSISTRPLTPVLDARWVLSGKAILILTSTGEWGIWDISSSNSSRGIAGSQPTPFAISGKIGSPIANTAVSRNTSARPASTSQLAPMTPGTRKMRQEALFGGSTSSLSNRGGISVKVATGPTLSAESDESITIWHGNSAVLLPSLRTFWQTKFGGAGSTFSSGTTGIFRELPTVAHSAELRVAVSALPNSDSTSVTSAKQAEFLVAAERSLTILTTPLPERQERGRNLLSTQTNAISEAQDSSLRTDNDQMLLDQGELGVAGLDRMLAGMDRPPVDIWSPTPTDRRRGVARKRVGFR